MQILSSSKDSIQRVAVINRKKLVDYFEHRDQNFDLGSIYKAKVKKIVPGLGCIFLDLGSGLSSFMKNIDVSKFHLGQKLMVQIHALEHKNKLTRSSMNISLQGLNIIYMPTKTKIGISREIDDENLRSKFTEELNKMNVQGGVILRSFAKKSKIKAIENELKMLQTVYKDIKKSKKQIGLIYKDDLLPIRVIKNFAKSGITKIYSDDKSSVLKIEQFLKKLSLKIDVSLYNKPTDILDQYDIKDTLKSVFYKKIYLPSGGYVVFDEAEGFVLIDVNTGSFLGKKNIEKTILKTNLEAAIEVCTQIRIRNYSGIILIDFIDMDKQSSKDKLLEALSLELKKDVSKTNLIGLTSLGLVEMTRKRTSPSLTEMLSKPCDNCMGRGFIVEDDKLLN